MKIAIFGGSFDPIHIAHKKIVETALKELDIDKLIISEKDQSLPNFKSARKAW